MHSVTFRTHDQSFSRSVKNAVQDYFTKNSITRKGDWRMYLKAILCIPAAVVIYLFLLFGDYSSLAGILLSGLFGLTLAFIAANVMHDACHGSFSTSRRTNAVMGLVMNALGSNSFLWKIRHNIHHTYTNVDGIDHDIANWPVLRQSPAQKLQGMHRYQHLYMLPLYALSSLIWVLAQDFEKYFLKKIPPSTSINISTTEHIIFWLSKILYVIFYAAVPIYFVGWMQWLVGFLIMHAVIGFVLTLVFQLAHVVEKTSFEAMQGNEHVIDREWAVHEVLTTANFATTNKAISWFVGGLNFQIEHHLFPGVCHVHYPALSKIVREECARFSLPYHAYPTVSDAVGSHYRFMKALGRMNSPSLIEPHPAQLHPGTLAVERPL
jgi:linoleoyl-CoA desaturase